MNEGVFFKGLNLGGSRSLWWTSFRWQIMSKHFGGVSQNRDVVFAWFKVEAAPGGVCMGIGSHLKLL